MKLRGWLALLGGIALVLLLYVGSFFHVRRSHEYLPVYPDQDLVGLISGVQIWAEPVTRFDALQTGARFAYHFYRPLLALDKFFTGREAELGLEPEPFREITWFDDVELHGFDSGVESPP